MRELDSTPPPSLPSCAIVGRGRLGTALASALPAVGVEVLGPLGRAEFPGEAGLVLLCVPDAEITATAAALAPGLVVGHCSGSLGLDALAPHEALGLHPLMTVTGPGAPLAGAGAAVAGTTPRAWARLGPRAALTGPIARGDAVTVARQRAAVAARAPELAPLWDALAERTRALAGAAP